MGFHGKEKVPPRPARTLVVGEQVVGAAQADEAHDRHQAGAHPQPRNGQAFEQPQNEGAYHQAAREVQRHPEGIQAAEQLRPQKDDERDAHRPQHRGRGPKEGGEPGEVDRREVQTRRRYHARARDPGHGPLAVERRDAPRGQGQRDEYDGSDHVEGREAEARRILSGEREGAVGVHRLRPCAKQPHARKGRGHLDEPSLPNRSAGRLPLVHTPSLRRSGNPSMHGARAPVPSPAIARRAGARARHPRGENYRRLREPKKPSETISPLFLAKGVEGRENLPPL